jgi:hypothetical protein
MENQTPHDQARTTSCIQYINGTMTKNKTPVIKFNKNYTQ